MVVCKHGPVSIPVWLFPVFDHCRLFCLLIILHSFFLYIHWGLSAGNHHKVLFTHNTSSWSEEGCFYQCIIAKNVKSDSLERNYVFQNKQKNKSC